MSELGKMQLSPRVRRTAVAAGVGAATAGLLSGVLTLGPIATSILLLVVFALAWPLAAVTKHVSDDVPFESPVLVAVLAAGAILCLPGLVKLLGWGALGLITLGVAAGLFVLLDLVIPSDRPKRRRRFRRKPASEKLLLLSRADELEDERLIASLQCPLSIEELCGVWCETTTTLAEGAGLRDRQAVAEVRRICLDEFERRNPDGFQRWIEAGAPSDPGTFLLPKPGE
ncbi:MAG TPA: hypothetical protein VFG33_23740 [Kribbella sp.]|uniref:hypothetical protein n=1 Tax=Kribbella sp. TaxID=1871183 RepID=UPI002D78976A|nr:hypothetical protein [Kribbella sp.]HET6296418.1 hypothetical protein [Kribbella sp.]